MPWLIKCGDSTVHYEGRSVGLNPYGLFARDGVLEALERSGIGENNFCRYVFCDDNRIGYSGQRSSGAKKVSRVDKRVDIALERVPISSPQAMVA